MALHCKACDSPMESDKDYVCNTCFYYAMRLIPKQLLDEDKLPQPKRPENLPKKEKRKDEWMENYLKAV